MAILYFNVSLHTRIATTHLSMHIFSGLLRLGTENFPPTKRDYNIFSGDNSIYIHDSTSRHLDDIRLQVH